MDTQKIVITKITEGLFKNSKKESLSVTEIAVIISLEPVNVEEDDYKPIYDLFKIGSIEGKPTMSPIRQIEMKEFVDFGFVASFANPEKSVANGLMKKIKDYSTALQSPAEQISVMIYSNTSDGAPKFRLYNQGKHVAEISTKRIL